MAYAPQHHWAEVNRPAPPAPPVRVYVWELPVRISHWFIVLSIGVLAFTGYYMHDPFIISRGSGAYLMASLRFIHLLAAGVFTAAFLLRLYWFFAGNEWSRWREFIPVRRRQWRGMGEMVKYYSFLRRDLVHHVGHNALAAATYSLIFLFMLVEIITGFAMYGALLGNRVLNALIGWLPQLIDIQYLRLVHFCLMFAFFAFAIHHVYSAVLVSWEERNGLIESIFTGYKFIPQEELEGDVLLHESAGKPARGPMRSARGGPGKAE